MVAFFSLVIDAVDDIEVGVEAVGSVSEEDFIKVVALDLEVGVSVGSYSLVV